jgi:archaellum component FlaD/FlaE
VKEKNILQSTRQPAENAEGEAAAEKQKKLEELRGAHAEEIGTSSPPEEISEKKPRKKYKKKVEQESEQSDLIRESADYIAEMVVTGEGILAENILHVAPLHELEEKWTGRAMSEWLKRMDPEKLANAPGWVLAGVMTVVWLPRLVDWGKREKEAFDRRKRAQAKQPDLTVS